MKKQSKWLKTFAKKNSIDLNNFAIRTGVSVSAARSWIVSGLVPKQFYWDRIAKTLGISETEVSENFLDQLGEEDRIRSCEICETAIILWKRNTKICDSKECNEVMPALEEGVEEASEGTKKEKKSKIPKKPKKEKKSKIPKMKKATE